MTKAKTLKIWLDGAENAYVTAGDMLRLKHYDWSLFFCHLALEKILKVALFKKGLEIPITHDLERLYKANKLAYDDALRAKLVEITKFNVSARYDDEKLQFYKKATEMYAKKWFKICEDLYLWIKASL